MPPTDRVAAWWNLNETSAQEPTAPARGRRPVKEKRIPRRGLPQATRARRDTSAGTGTGPAGASVRATNERVQLVRDPDVAAVGPILTTRENEWNTRAQTAAPPNGPHAPTSMNIAMREASQALERAPGSVALIAPAATTRRDSAPAIARRTNQRITGQDDNASRQSPPSVRSRQQTKAVASDALRRVVARSASESPTLRPPQMSRRVDEDLLLKASPSVAAPLAAAARRPAQTGFVADSRQAAFDEIPAKDASTAPDNRVDRAQSESGRSGLGPQLTTSGVDSRAATPEAAIGRGDVVDPASSIFGQRFELAAKDPRQAHRLTSITTRSAEPPRRGRVNRRAFFSVVQKKLLGFHRFQRASERGAESTLGEPLRTGFIQPLSDGIAGIGRVAPGPPALASFVTPEQSSQGLPSGATTGRDESGPNAQRLGTAPGVDRGVVQQPSRLPTVLARSIARRSGDGPRGASVPADVETERFVSRSRPTRQMLRRLWLHEPVSPTARELPRALSSIDALVSRVDDAIIERASRPLVGVDAHVVGSLSGYEGSAHRQGTRAFDGQLGTRAPSGVPASPKKTADIASAPVEATSTESIAGRVLRRLSDAPRSTESIAGSVLRRLSDAPTIGRGGDGFGPTRRRALRDGVGSIARGAAQGRWRGNALTLANESTSVATSLTRDAEEAAPLAVLRDLGGASRAPSRQIIDRAAVGFFGEPQKSEEEVRRWSAPAQNAASVFRQVLGERAPDPLTPLPTHLQPLATSIVGHAGVQLSVGEASRAALDAAGKQAATLDGVIHLRNAPTNSPRSQELVAHELVHVAHRSSGARFFEDDTDSREEWVARRVGALARSLGTSEPARVARTYDIQLDTPAISLSIAQASAMDLLERRSASPSIAGESAPPGAQRLARATRASSPSGQRLVSPARPSPRSDLQRAVSSNIAELPLAGSNERPDSGSSARAPSEQRRSTVDPVPAPPLVETSRMPIPRETLDWIIEQIEQRVIDELERRGLRTNPGVW